MLWSPYLWRFAIYTYSIGRCVLWRFSIWRSPIWKRSIGRCSIWDCSTGRCSIWRCAIGEGLFSPSPRALIINKTSSLMLQVQVLKTRLPGILGDKEIERAASCSRLDAGACHVWMASTMQHAATHCNTLRYAATRWIRRRLDWHMNIERWGAGVETHFQEISWNLRPVVNGT